MIWIRVTDALPEPNETVWGYDVFYHAQGECKRAGWNPERLVFLSGHRDDCLITHWYHARVDPPCDADNVADRLMEETK
jgi:hypothetical protein